MKIFVFALMTIVLNSCTSKETEKKPVEKMNDSVEKSTKNVSKGVKSLNSNIRSFFDKHKTEKKKKVDSEEAELEKTD